MSLLLDTHILIWAAKHTSKLNADTLKLLQEPSADLWFSVANLWEMSIKKARRPDFDVDPADLRLWFLQQGFRELSISYDHALAVQHLPFLHNDPFDRMLIAQAQVEGLTLMTADKAIARYDGPIEFVG